MQLTSQLFSGDRKLEAAANVDADHVALGARGDHVRKIQLALIALDGATLKPDGVYGPATAAAVLAYKRKRSIVNPSYQKEADAIVGKMTIAALDREMSELERRRSHDDDDHPCGNGYASNSALASTIRQQFNEKFANVATRGQGNAFALTSASVGAPLAFAFPSSPFSHILPLSPAQVALATSVFGSSIELALVFISDFKGAEGRAFTLAFGGVAIINAGSFTPLASTLIHELTHVWQSQHHPNSTEYITNSVGSQALARVVNQAAGKTDASLTTNSQFPNRFPNSPYASIPGAAFGDYGAEQIAKQVELNFASSNPKIKSQTAAIVGHVKSVAKFAKDGDNIASLKAFRFEDKRNPKSIF